ncbi:MAG: DUF3830 family protein [archaeon]
MKKIVLNLDGAKAIAVLHEREMPKTCKAIWNLLPLKGKSIHANWAGRETMLHLEGAKYVKLEQEGAKRAPGPGHISYFFRAPGVLRGQQAAYNEEFKRGLCELAIYYGAEAPSMRDVGREPDPERSVNNWFASFEMPVPVKFVQKCDDLNFTGMNILTITRYRGA